jgi:hypothetical protein
VDHGDILIDLFETVGASRRKKKVLREGGLFRTRIGWLVISPVPAARQETQVAGPERPVAMCSCLALLQKILREMK